MNTNTSIPTFGLDNDADGIAQWLSIDWVDGRGEQQHRSLKLDHEAHDGGYDHIVYKLREMVQHLWLTGYEQGSGDCNEARALGYANGMIEDAVNPWRDATDGRFQAWANGREARQADVGTGQRIEGLIGTVSSERETIANLQRQLATVTSERDEAIESLGHIQRDLIIATSPGEGDETVTRAAYDSLAEQGRILLESRAARITELESALAAADTDLVNAKIVVEQVQNEKERVERDMQARIDLLHHDLDIVRDRLLEEAQSRGWCSEYDEFARGVNAQTEVFDLHVRSTTYNVTVTVTQDVDYSPVDAAAQAAEFPISYDVSNGCVEGVEYHFTLEDVAEADIDSKAEQLRRAIYAVSGISSASVSYEESD